MFNSSQIPLRGCERLTAYSTLVPHRCQRGLRFHQTQTRFGLLSFEVDQVRRERGPLLFVRFRLPERAFAFDAEPRKTLLASVDRFDRIQTWAAAMTISVAALLQSYGGDAGKIEEMPGVEDALRADFIRLGRPISGVETGPQQLGFLASLGPETQQAMLDQLVDSYRAGDTDLGEPNEAAWVSGDVQSIATEFDDMPAELFDVLISRRNAAWTDWLIHRLDRPGTLLFAVGAAHLAGTDSVQAMLAARGFRVRRVQ